MAAAAARPTRSGSTGAGCYAPLNGSLQRDRLIAALDAADPNGDILAAWIAKELLRDVLACTATGGLRYDIAAALYRFYAFCAATSAPEIHDRAEPSKPGRPQ